MNAIAIRGLVKRYGAHTLFDGLDLDVGHGELLAILGASGCGNATAVWVTHDVDDALTLATRTIVLHRTTNSVQAIEPAVGIDIGVRRALLAALGVPA